MRSLPNTAANQWKQTCAAMHQAVPFCVVQMGDRVRHGERARYDENIVVSERYVVRHGPAEVPAFRLVTLPLVPHNHAENV
jgi:hypothetical protein